MERLVDAVMIAVKLARLPPEVSVPAASWGKPMTLASHATHAFSMRTAPGLAEANPEYLLDVAARRSPNAEKGTPPPGMYAMNRGDVVAKPG